MIHIPTHCMQGGMAFQKGGVIFGPIKNRPIVTFFHHLLLIKNLSLMSGCVHFPSLYTMFLYYNVSGFSHLYNVHVHAQGWINQSQEWGLWVVGLINQSQKEFFRCLVIIMEVLLHHLISHRSSWPGKLSVQGVACELNLDVKKSIFCSNLTGLIIPFSRSTQNRFTSKFSADSGDPFLSYARFTLSYCCMCMLDFS